MTTIKLKNGSGAPTSGDLAQGEPALDLTNKRLYTEDSGGTVIEVGTNPGVDVTFADNRKAVFGAGSDLQIYHDGGNTFINEGGTGSLYIQARDLYLRDYDTSVSFINMLNNGAVTLHHAGNAKLSTTSTGIDVTGVITTDGMTTSADINFGDNDKAIFGAGSDLNIYHDGSNSYISENGTGNLIIGAGAGVFIKNKNLDENLLSATQNGSVQLFYDNAEKLETTSTGINVTGTVTADGLTVDAGSTSLVGTLQTTADNSSLVYSDASQTLILKNDDASGTARLKFLGTASESGAITFGSGVGATSDTFAVYPRVMAGGKAFNITGGGDISFYEDTGTTAKLFWDASAESLGIGTSSPSAGLELNLASGDGLLINSADVGTIKMKTTAGSVKNWGFAHTNLAAGDFGIYQSNSNGGDPITAGTARMYFNGTGDVGIGTSSPSAPLHVNGNGKFNNIEFGGYLSPYGDDTYINMLGSGRIQFRTNGSEAMRIDSSGNLLVGTTTTDGGFDESDGGASTVFMGASIGGAANGSAFVSRRAAPLQLNRQANDGDIAVFRKDGSTVGSIGTTGSNLVIGTGDTGFRFFDGSPKGIFPASTSSGVTDGVIDLGKSNGRFDDIYATNGTIQTSDRNEKQDIEALSDAEQRVAVAAKGLLRKFRWIDSVADKGDDARIHFGIVAQDLQDAFTAEGLDAGRYAMFISTAWTDEETGEERTRMGVRYSELLAFIIAAI
jgi:hypothetical protein